MSAYRKEGSIEKTYVTANGIAMLLLLIALVAAEIAGILVLKRAFVWPAIGVAIAIAFVAPGFFMLQPNQAVVLTLFGEYLGTDRAPGLRWTLPWNLRKKLSVRARNHNIDQLKVNDKRGNPVEIAAVVVWRVEDTAQALFDVEDYENFVKVQAEAAIRHVASEYPYDHIEDEGPSLRANADDVTATLQSELQVRLNEAGVSVLDCRLRRLAYAPEIAGEMLRRQQAGAVIAARKLIVRGAVTMVQDALEQLAAEHIVELDEERKAAMVSNLMVVLTGDRSVQPVVNAGTLYPG